MGFSTPPLSVSVGTYLPFTVMAFDGAGHPLRNVPILLKAPATGASGTFNIFTDPPGDDYIATPDPLSTTISTGATCDQASPLYIANVVAGSYIIDVKAGAAEFSLPILNTPSGIAAEIGQVLAKAQIAHIGQEFEPFQVVVRDLDSLAIAGVPVTFTAPTGTGSTGLFPGGSSSATVPTNAFGRARSPVLTANGVAGYFYLTASVPGVAPIAMGPLVNGGGTVTTLQRASNTLDPVTFGQRVGLNATVQFNGFPSSGGTGGPATFPPPHGKVVVRTLGTVVASKLVDDLAYRFSACAGCANLTLRFYLESRNLSFGTHELVASYEPAGEFDASSSAPIAQTIQPAFISPTAGGQGESLIGVTGGASPWACTLRAAEWVPASRVTGTLPAGSTVPYGVLQYRIDTCGYNALIGVPPGGFHASQHLVLQLPEALPATAVFMAYGPTSQNAIPHWYSVPSQVDGNVMRIFLGDGDPGDDDLTRNGVIAGQGAIALTLPPQAIPASSASTVAILALLIGFAMWHRSRMRV